MPDAHTAWFDPVGYWARVDGTRTAVIDAASDRVVSYAALDDEADRWAAALVAEGVRANDRVAVLAHNRYEFLPLFLACLRCGAVLVPLNWRLAAPELAGVLRHAAPRVLFAESRFDAYRTLTDVPRWIALDGEAQEWVHRAPAGGMPHARAAPDATGLAMLLYTSGTTGAPKGVMITHRQLVWNAMSTVAGWSLGANDVAPVTTPFFHTAAWHVFTTPLLFCGGSVVVLPNFQATVFLEALARFRVTVAFAVPTQWRMVQQAESFGHRLPALRFAISGGAPLWPDTGTALREAGYPVRDAYGLTECGPNCFVMPDARLATTPGAVGWPLPFVRMRVRDSQGAPVATGVAGELQLQGPQLFAGYFRDEARTADAFTADGWFRTGDLVTVGDDGAFTVCGRVKDMYITGGENVYAGEVEAALLAGTGVREVAVVGVPDAMWGEVGYAFVVPTHPAVRTGELLADARKRLAAYKVPKTVQWLAALPLLGSGKVDRAALRSLALQASRSEH